MVDIKTIIKALRCSSTAGSKCDNSCPYYYVASEEEQKAFYTKFGVERMPDDFWGGCDCDRIAMDAADALERLTDGKC